MAINILKNQKNAFWEALLVAVLIFGIGILFGVFIENTRADEIAKLYLQSEVNLLDVRIGTEVINLDLLNCEQAIKKNIEFGDKIYNEAKLLTKYEKASRITEALIEQHKRYDLLRTLFWINSIKVKQKCNQSFHTVVYLYNYEPEEIIEKNKQVIFSRYLSEVKQKYGNQIVLIPIAKNLNLDSINTLTQIYNINQTSIIINEELIITELEELFQINDYLEKDNIQ